MANNVTLNPGSGGPTVSTEDNGTGVQLARTKLMLGAAGIDGGDVTTANPLPTQEQSTPITGQALPAGGVGMVGWLSQIVARLNAIFQTQSIRVNAGGAAPGQTLKSYSGKIALSTSGATTVPIETVTSGKTFYVTDLYLGHDTSAVLDVRLQAGGVDIFRAPVKGDTAPIQMAGLETGPSAGSGQQVNVVYPTVGTATNGFFYLAGYEQ